MASSLPPAVVTPAEPAPGIADAMRAMAAPATPDAPAPSPAAPQVPTSDSSTLGRRPRSPNGQRAPRDHKREYERRKQRTASALGAPYVPPASASPNGAAASGAATLTRDDITPRGPNGAPLAQYEQGIKSLAGALKMLGELLAWWRGPHWRVTDEPPDHDATNLARVCAEAWPELLETLGDAPQLVAVAAIAAMVGPRLAEDRRLSKLRNAELGVAVEVPRESSDAAPISAPVEGAARGRGWNATVSS